MSNFDPRIPAGSHLSQPILHNDVSASAAAVLFDFARGNTEILLRASSTGSATESFVQTNYNARGCICFLNITTFPASGSTTLALKVRAATPFGDSTIINHTARSATGTTQLIIYPGITSAGGVAANTPLPRNLRFIVSFSTGATVKDVTWGLDVAFIV